MSIAVKQIDQTQLAAFVKLTASGASFSGNLLDYVNNKGYLGSGVVAATGGSQTIYTDISFFQSPSVPYSGTTGEAVARKYIDDLNDKTIKNYSGFATGNYVSAVFSNTFTATNTFTQNVFLPKATNTGHATNLSDLVNVSGILQSGINNVSIAGSVYVFGEQLITGKKIFAAGATVSAPSEPSGVVNLAYLTGNFTVANAVATTGNQNISGVKIFLNSPLGPIGTAPTSFVTKQQLDALGISMGGVNGFAGVISVNAQSGASGHLFFQGAGNVTVSNCAGLFTFSGQESQSTKIYSNTFLLATGATGLRVNFSSEFGETPAILSSMQTSAGPSSVIFDTIYNVNISGFNISFSNPIVNTGTYYSFLAAPSLLSGYLALKGEQGIQGVAGQNGTSPNLRDVWQNGIVYNPLDIVYQEPNSYACKLFHFSSHLNAPSGAGTTNWQLFSSGLQRVSGSWDYRGDFNISSIYGRTSAVYLSGSTYGYSGISPISGISPANLTGGWHYIARVGSGIVGPSGSNGANGTNGTNGTNGINGTAGTGVVTFNFRGNYDNGTSYNGTPDIVYYSGSSFAYTGNSPIVGVTPDNAMSGWAIIAAKGNDGSIGADGIAGPTGATGPAGTGVLGINFKGTYDNDVLYYNNPDMVYYDGSSYAYTGTNPVSGVIPTYFDSGWAIVAAKGLDSTGVSPTATISEKSFSSDFGVWMQTMQDDFYVTGIYVYSDGSNDSLPDLEFQLSSMYSNGILDENILGSSLFYETGLFYKFFEINPPLVVPASTILKSNIYQDNGFMGNRLLTVAGYSNNIPPSIKHRSYSCFLDHWSSAVQKDFHATGLYFYSDGANDVGPDLEIRLQGVYYNVGTNSLDANEFGGSVMIYETGLYYKFFEITPPITIPSSYIIKASSYGTNNGALGNNNVTVVGYTE